MTKGFQDLQYQLAAHIRDPKKNPAPAGTHDRQLNIYRNLFFNNITGFISGAFPVLKKFYSEDDWRNLIRRFYAQHDSHSPYFSDIAKEFLSYLQKEYHPDANDPPFMTELAHYEWVELALSLANDEIDEAAIDPHGDMLNASPVLSPLAWRLTYRWPVHRIGPDFCPQQPGDTATHLVVCRDHNDKINFTSLNTATDLLLDEIAKHPQRTGLEQLKQVAQQLHLTDMDGVVRHGVQTFAKIRDLDVILGTWKNVPA